MVIAQTMWCAKQSQTMEVLVPMNVRSAELWYKLQQLISKKYPGANWPETVKARGITKAELTQYIYALKPNHRYFSKSF